MPRRAEPPGPPTAALRAAQEAAMLTLALAQRLQQGYGRHASGVGLTPTQAKTLMALRPDEDFSQRELADAVGLDPSNLTAVLDRLEERGEVRRRLGSADRRVKIVVLTEAGLATRDAFATALRGDPGPLAALSSAQLGELGALLRIALADPTTES